ncbi:MAG: GntR family transcriptional regulator [Chloroflexota bacterium]
MKRLDEIPGENRSLQAQVFREIELAILDGAFAPGDSLTELHLSADLGVSRTPVREALRQLEREGLVRTIPNKGAVVVGVSEKDIDDIYTIRTYIEGLAARWAAESVTDEEITALREVVELQEFYVSRDDAKQVWHLDTRFHELIYECCRSRPLRQTLSSFHHYIQKARALSFKTAGRAKVAVQEHRDILEAIAKRDASAAERLTAAHIRNAKRNFLETNLLSGGPRSPDQPQ